MKTGSIIRDHIDQAPQYASKPALAQAQKGTKAAATRALDFGIIDEKTVP